jgi:hypothetical protein
MLVLERRVLVELVVVEQEVNVILELVLQVQLIQAVELVDQDYKVQVLLVDQV